MPSLHCIVDIRALKLRPCENSLADFFDFSTSESVTFTLCSTKAQIKCAVAKANRNQLTDWQSRSGL